MANVVALRQGQGGEIPLPHNIEAEQALLGAILVNNEAFGRIADIVTAKDFYEPIHSQIFDIIEFLIGANRVATPVSMKTLVGEIQIPGLTASQYLARLAAEATTVINAIDYARLIKDAAVRRNVFIACEQMQQRILNGDPKDSGPSVIEDLEAFIGEVRPRGTGTGQNFKPFATAAADAMQMASAAYSNKGLISGMSTGLDKLDGVLGGINRGDLVVIGGRPAMGKAQPLTEPVLMRDGSWKAMGSLRLGDELASHDGRRSRVLGLYPQGRREVSRIVFSDGRYAECCDEHLWRVYYRDWPAARVVDTAELRRLLSKDRYKRRLWIDVVSGHFGSTQALPVDAWLLGALLGDGTMRGTVRFSTVEPHILDAVVEAAGEGMKSTYAGHNTYRIVRSAGAHSAGIQGVTPNPIKAALQGLGLWGCDSFSKFIPQCYLNADRETRLDLLRGLMDTDGWVEAHGSTRFCTVSPDLAAGVRYLVRSVGGLCSVVEKKTPGQLAYMCKIRHPNAETLFRSVRKKERALRGKNATVRLTVDSISPIGHAETQCIKVSHPDSLYVTGNFTVTHNTALAVNIAYTVARSLVERRLDKEKTGVVGFFSLEMPADQLAGRILSEHSKISGHRLRRGQVSEAEITAYLDSGRVLHNLPIEIDATPALRISQLAMRARALHKRKGLEMLAVDYIQLLKGSSTDRNINRVQELTEITGTLKELAKELGIPVIALSQLSRDIEKRDDKRPHLADLRESGSIEQDADAVLFVYRDEYYLKGAEPRAGTEAHNEWSVRYEAARGRAEIIVGKNRHGPAATVEVGYIANITQFNNDVPEKVMPDRKKEARAPKRKPLRLNREAVMALHELKTLVLVESIENAGHVDKAAKGTKLVRYSRWKEKCAAALHEGEPSEAKLTKTMEAIFRELQAPGDDYPPLIGRGGSKTEPYVWLVETK